MWPALRSARRTLTLLAAAALAAIGTGAAQPRPERVDWGVVFATGIAHDVWKGVPDVGFQAVGARFGYRAASGLDVGAEVYPVFLMFQDTSTFAVSTTLVARYRFETGRRVRPFVTAGAGVLYSAGEIPAGATTVNFTPQLGAGVALSGDEGVVYTFEYRLHHISNARLSENNPGFNSSSFQFAVSFER